MKGYTADWLISEHGCKCPHCQTYFPSELMADYLRMLNLPESCILNYCPKCGSDMHIRKFQKIVLINGEYRYQE